MSDTHLRQKTHIRNKNIINLINVVFPEKRMSKRISKNPELRMIFKSYGFKKDFIDSVKLSSWQIIPNYFKPSLGYVSKLLQVCCIALRCLVC